MQNKTIGLRIRQRRRALGITQAALAEQLGLSNKAISKWERDLSCPDISLLPALARVLGVSAAALLGMADEDAPAADRFVSLEKYLMGEYGYTVPDYHPSNEEIVLLFDCPNEDDASHGVCLSGKMGVEASRYLYGIDAPLSDVIRRNGRIGVSYISNVPLSVPMEDSHPLSKLACELEYTRLSSTEINRFLMEGFTKKITDILSRESVRVIAFTRWWNQKYFGAFVGRAAPRLLARVQERIQNGTLKFLFIGLPTHWNSPTGHLYEAPTLREMLASEE